MDGRISDGTAKGKFHGPECRGNWKVTLDETALPPKARTQAKAAPAADDAPPVIDVPGELSTDRSVVELNGHVHDGSTIVEFTVNGAAAEIGADGSFHLKRGVAVGHSDIIIAALEE